MSRVPVLRIVSLSLASLLACTPQTELGPDPRPEIDAAQARFWDAHEQGDPTALASMVTDDALLWVPGAEEIRGREAIQAAAEGMFAAMSISDFQIESRELEIHGDRAYELATYSQTVTYQGAEPTSVRGRYLLVWAKDSDGAWRVRRNMFHYVSGA